MKHIYRLLSTIILISVLNACDKMDDLPHYTNGSAIALSASTSTIAPTPGDSTKNVLTLSWTNPTYATDSANQKFIVEIDSSGRNFAHETTFEVDGPLSYSLTGGQLNNALANFGFKPGQPFKVDIRVTSSYANNNEQYKSNVVTTTMTPYLVPIALTPSPSGPLVLQISSAFDNAVTFNWGASAYGNNVINYALQLDVAGDNFANPQTFQAGADLTKAIIQSDLNNAAIAAGVIGGSTKNVEFRVVSYLGTTYTTPLVYSNTVTIGVTTYVSAPDHLYIIGDATPEVPQWDNSANLAPMQEFTKIDAVSFGIILNLKPGGYLLLPENQGLWTHKWGGSTDGTTGGGGTLLADNAVPGSNTPAPGTAGVYKIVVNFQTNKYTVTPYTGIPLPTSIGLNQGLWMVGDATPGGWNNNSSPAPVGIGDQKFTQLSNSEYQISIHLNGGGGYLLLPEDVGQWSNKYGGATDGTAAAGTLLFNNDVPGSNTPAPAASGTYKINVNFITGKYTVKPN